jgi:hypothetical protein
MPHTVGLALSAAALAVAFGASVRLGIPLKDPEGFIGPAYVRLPVIALAFFAAGIIPQAIFRSGWRRIGPGIVEIVRTEWSLARVLHITAGLLTFFVTYVSYRNMKSFLPLLRTNDDGSVLLYDSQLLRLDHWLGFGHNPGELLHSVLGTSFSAQILATVYVSYLMLVPVSLGAFLVLYRDISRGAWYATALGVNWVLGAVSYYLIPTLGPAFAQPQSFRSLDGTGASALQQSLMKAGWFFREDPNADTIYGIAGFASLHVSVALTACLFFRAINLHRYLRNAAWTYLVLVIISTSYFGWHYLADDIAGAVIGWVAYVVGAWATGNRLVRLRRPASVLSAVPAATGS